MLKAGTETGSLMNHLMSGDSAVVPEVGMGVTILFWTDRRAATITEVITTKKGTIKEIVTQDDYAIRTDMNGESESQRYNYVRNPEGSIRTARLLKGGWRILEGKDSENGRNIYGAGLLLGKRAAYHDYNF